jgi:hypothetical protein
VIDALSGLCLVLFPASFCASSKTKAQPFGWAGGTKLASDYFDIAPPLWQVLEMCFMELTSSVWEFPAAPAVFAALPPLAAEAGLEVVPVTFTS